MSHDKSSTPLERSKLAYALSVFLLKLLRPQVLAKSLDTFALLLH